MKKVSIVLGMCLLLLGMAACSRSEQKQAVLTKQDKARLDSIDKAAFKVGVMPTLDCLPVFVAYEDSMFLRQGVTVHLRRYTSQMDCDTALMRGRVEGSVTDLIRAARMERKGTELTYPVSTNLYWQLISNRRARISNLSQLSDKMIAMTRFSATDYLSDLAVDSGKPKFDVYRVQINDVGIRLRMLINNEMDAMFLPEPQATKARLEQHAVLMDSRNMNLQLGVFAFRKKILRDAQRRQQMAKFLKCYDMAVDSINKNGLQKYAELLKKYCGCDNKTIKSLPRLRYEHAMEPRKRDLDLAHARAK